MNPRKIKVDHEYHGVELHNIKPPEEMFEWLYQNAKDRWFYKHPMVYFENKLDHMMFLIRWG